MCSRTVRGVVAPIALLLLIGAVRELQSQDKPRQAGSEATAEAPTEKTGQDPAVEDIAESAKTEGLTEVEKTIRAFEETFVRDFNKGDSKAIAAHFTEDAEVVDAEGELYQGREVIEQGFAEMFADDQGAKIELEIFSIRSLSPDVAQEHGRSVVTPKEGAPRSRLYSIVYVKRDGRWLVSSVRDDLDPMVSPHDRLMDLEWMVGEWVDEGEDSLVRLNCRWSDDENYLLRSFTVHQNGEAVLSVSQRIGWDPIARQIRSWEFDTAGGFGEGWWTRDGERWVVKHTGVQPEGKTASGTNTMTRERSDLVRWTSTDRVIGDQIIPDGLSYTLVRVPPAPASVSTGRPISPPSSSPRSPR